MEELQDEIKNLKEELKEEQNRIKELEDVLNDFLYTIKRTV